MSTQQEQPQKPAPAGSQNDDELKRRTEELSAQVQAHLAKLRGGAPK